MSRVHKIGSIYTRIDGLIRKKFIDVNEKPLWFDVYRQFPPKYEPFFKRELPKIKIREIFYKEDIQRARIHKEFEGELGDFNLLDNSGKSKSETLLKSCLTYISEGMSYDEAINKLKATYMSSNKAKAKKDSEVISKDIENVTKIISD